MQRNYTNYIYFVTSDHILSNSYMMMTKYKDNNISIVVISSETFNLHTLHEQRRTTLFFIFLCVQHHSPCNEFCFILEDYIHCCLITLTRPCYPITLLTPTVFIRCRHEKSANTHISWETWKLTKVNITRLIFSHQAFTT